MNKYSTKIIGLVTVLWLLYFLLIWLVPVDYFFEFGNIKIVIKSINLGEFGSLISGVFAPLAFLWLFQNFKQQDENLKIAHSQLKILIEERENRRRVKKAYFKITQMQSNDSGINILSFKPRNPAFNINLELIAPTQILELLLHNKYYEDYIYPDDVLEVSLHSKLEHEELIKGDHNYALSISYLDEDGFDCREWISVSYDARCKQFVALSAYENKDQPFGTKIHVLKKRFKDLKN